VARDGVTDGERRAHASRMNARRVGVHSRERAGRDGARAGSRSTSIDAKKIRAREGAEGSAREASRARA